MQVLKGVAMQKIETVGGRIKRLRKQKHITQEELAEQLFITRQAVSNWELDINEPSIYFLVELHKYFHVSLEYLLTGK